LPVLRAAEKWEPQAKIAGKKIVALTWISTRDDFSVDPERAGGIATGFDWSDIAGDRTSAKKTVRSHFKKAQAKLGTRNRMHTLAQAMRDLLII
jgi:hypothetical protein